MPAPLSNLLGESWSFFQKHITAIVIAAVVLSVLHIVLRLTVFSSVAPEAMKMFNRMGMDQTQLMELQQRMQRGDESAMREFQEEIGKMAGNPEAGKMMGMQTLVFLGAIGPTIALSMFVSFLLSFAGSVYYFFIALENTPPQAALKRTGEYIFLMLGLAIWIFLRSFAWIPFLGVILGVILMPRFILSSIILVKEGKSITKSASESYRRTAGYWGKIAGNIIVAVICVWIATWVITFVIGMLGRQAVFFVNPLAYQASLAFLVIFKTKLGLSILAEPKVAIS